MIARLLALCAGIAALGLSCSSSPTAGGGSDLPNGAVAALVGSVVLPDSITAASGAHVVLRGVTIAQSGDSVTHEYASLTDENGAYRLDTIVPGRYVLSVTVGGSRLTGLNQFVEVGDSGDTRIGPLRLGERVDLVGFLALPQGYFYAKASVSIPGTGVRSTVDVNRMYVLPDVPAGEYDIAYRYEDIVNFLRVSVAPRDSVDTVAYLRNVDFAALQVMGGPSHAFLPIVVPTAYAVTPKVYPPGKEPSWYTGGIDLSRVSYYDWPGGTLSPWDPAQATVPTAYDTVLTGMLYRDSTGAVFLETVDEHILTMSLPPSVPLGAAPAYVTLAALVREDAGRTVYDIVEVRFRDPTDGTVPAAAGDSSPTAAVIVPVTAP